MIKSLSAGFFFLAAASAASAQTSATSPGLWERDYLLGDPAGLRTKLKDAGFSPFATLSSEVWGNVRGGIRRGATSDTLLEFGTGVDLEKLTGWKGASFRVSAHYLEGTRINQKVGASQSPTDFDGADHFRIYNLYLRQKLVNDQFTLKIGQLGYDDDFCQPLGLVPFLNNAITSPPIIYGQVLANRDASLPQYPLDAPGIFGRYDPTDVPFYSMTGAYLSDPGPDRSSNHGLEWHPHNSFAVLHENGWHYHLLSKEDTLAAGAFYNDGKFTNWDTGAQEHGVYGVYAYVNQVLLTRPGQSAGEAETVLSGYVYAGWAGPDARAIPTSNYSAGVNWNGLFPGRPKDTAGLAVLYTGFSSRYTRSAFNPNGPGVSTASETAVELTYQMVLSPWLTLRPDAQLIFNPANSRTRATAVVLGLRASVSF